MNAWYLLSFLAWLILAITAAARLADMGRSQWSMCDHVRRLGIIGVGVSAFWMMVAPMASDWWRFDVTSWQDAVFAWAWAFVWITTPRTPPWWDYILGVHRRTDEWSQLGLWARIRGELGALRDSFKPSRYRPTPDDQAPAAPKS